MKEEKVWIELTPAQFERPFLLAASRTTGLGERGLYPHWTLGRHVVAFRRVHGNVQLLARNTRFDAPADAGLARAARLSFSDSLLGSAALASAEHPERKSVLVELGALLLTDLPQLSRQLEAQFRLSYGFDARNSFFRAVRADDQAAVFEVTAHYSVPRLPAPPPGPIAPGSPVPSTPRNLEDARSFFVDYQYSLAALPEPAMAPRMADPRIGHFVQQTHDFGNPVERDSRRYLVNRWRLDKKDPAAELSEPVRPIVFWIDRNTPARYRQAIADGVLEWNKAFEKIGIRNAIQAPLEPENAPMDLTGLRHASIRWFLDNDEGALAVGPSVTDPRTGEIVDADIAISDNWARLVRRVAREQAAPSAGASAPSLAASSSVLPASSFHDHGIGASGHGPACTYASDALAELDFTLALLEARGEFDAGSPQAEAVVTQVLKDVTMHEVGHTLGLRHNFRASLAVPTARLNDPAFTRANGLSGSVMDYNGFNLPLEGEPRADIAMNTLGPYDYWAIEYAYRPLAPDSEAAELARIAGRSGEPALAYGTDEEVSAGYDPQVNQRDLGDDPLAFATRRLKLSRELWSRLQTRALPAGASYGVLRQNFESGLRQFEFAADLAAKQVGGVRYFRDLAGDARPSFVPEPAARQREALALLAREVFSAQSMAIDPALVARLSQNALDRGYAPPSLPGLPQSVLALQRRLLDRLLGDAVLARIQESESTLAQGADRLRMPELFDTLRQSVWQELEGGREIAVTRRMLQREHVRKLVGLLMRPATGVPADARSLARADALRLAEQIRSAMRSRQVSRESLAHLDESLATLRDALKASLSRSAG
ncbi:MAG: zinc-dependent metalloprotease [Burkholderiales bacterium]|nr:zinc-dependent metalloprotease [Burkholderiales bacterium]